MSILEVGRNCRRIDPAEKAAVLVDGADYFRSLAHAVREAERYVLIAGWEIDSQTRLLRGDDGNLTLEALLRETAAKKDGPVVNILSWDFSVVFAMEREAWSGVKLGWTGGEKVRFKLDGQHPLGASQHQKIVVVDGNGWASAGAWTSPTGGGTPRSTARTNPVAGIRGTNPTDPSTTSR